MIDPHPPAIVCDTIECCADFCANFLSKCVAVGWAETGDHGCNFQCHFASNDTKPRPGTSLAVVRSHTNDLCRQPEPPSPAHLYPRIHYAPQPVYAAGNWHDIAGAITHNGVHHIYQGTGWRHHVSRDLVHWQSGPPGPAAITETYKGMLSHDYPCSGFITKDPDDGNRVCAGFRQCGSQRGVRGFPHPWDVPLELRCAKDDQLANWTSDPSSPLFDYLFNVSFWRPVPYDPARPWREADGNFYQLLSLDGCNASGYPSTHAYCPSGGQLVMWRSRALRGARADWRQVGPVFTSNQTVLANGFLHKEFVTIDYIGFLPGDPAGGKTRLLLNNVGGNGGGDGCCSGTTSYFPVTQVGPGAPFEQVGPQGMVDWGAFTLNSSAVGVPGLTGTSLLLGTASRGLSMARTLGSEESDQVAKPGRRVLIGWTGPADFLVQVESHLKQSTQSLPRDLSLAPDRSLRQRFVPELQVLRLAPRKRGRRVTEAGLQAEVLATFPKSCAGVGGRACGLELGSLHGRLLVDPALELVTLDLTGSNNSAVRAGPAPPVAGGGGYEVHMYIDHAVIELIVNNATALVAYWCPPARLNESLALTVVGDGEIEAWELASANNLDFQFD